MTHIPKYRRRRWHDTTNSPLALYQLDGTNRLTDSSGNAKTLTESITAEDGPGYLLNTRSLSDGRLSRVDSSFQILGAVTIAALVRLDKPAISSAAIAMCAGSGEIEANNITWELAVDGQNLRWIHEHGSGVNDTLSSTYNLGIGEWYHICGSRDSAGTTVNLYLNGSNVGSSSSLTAPSGGTGSNLSIMDHPDGGFRFAQPIASLAIYSSELTPSQIASLARSCGFRPII